MTKDEYGDFVLRYKGCGACFPMYHTLSRFEKMWFTAIQKDVAELEKENAELKNRLEHRNCLDCSNHSSKLRMRTFELEKENAELKHIIATLRQEKDNVSMHAKAMEVVAKTRSDQLTKAKEIIKDLLGSENTSCEEEMFFEIRQKAEQFLKECK